MMFESDRKWQQSPAEKGHVWKESGVTAQGRKEAEVGILLQSSDKTMLLLVKHKLFLVFKDTVQAYFC